MAIEIIRTAADDAHDALRALDEAEREIRRWRAHLDRLNVSGSIADALQARRCASIVAACITDAVNRTRDAVCHAELPADALSA